MKKQKLTFDEFASKAKKLSKEEQLKMVGGRRSRGGVSSWSSGRGGIIDDDNEVRVKKNLTRGGI